MQVGDNVKKRRDASMRINGNGLHRSGAQFFFSFDPEEPIEREEDEQLEKANRLSILEWSFMNSEKF